ncbi:hypothetical protein EAG_07567 [Camponotus floridanus]|uniref:Uncharacterized protein n=1 Tax=Camponotus floridanus TaxID=104421 RepID=E2A450_CAMFO|nr:hypothetical protein EAG_07567 [Camponotus floridanus]
MSPEAINSCGGLLGALESPDAKIAKSNVRVCDTLCFSAGFVPDIRLEPIVARSHKNERKLSDLRYLETSGLQRTYIGGVPNSHIAPRNKVRSAVGNHDGRRNRCPSHELVPTSSRRRGVVDVASFDVASQGPRGATRVALSNTIFWFAPPTATVRRVKIGGKTTRRVTSIDREPSAPRSVATPASQATGGSLRSTFRARTELCVHILSDIILTSTNPLSMFLLQRMIFAVEKPI